MPKQLLQQRQLRGVEHVAAALALLRLLAASTAAARGLRRSGTRGEASGCSRWVLGVGRRVRWVHTLERRRMHTFLAGSASIAG